MAPYAADPAQSRGRLHGGRDDPASLRDSFQRDRDRIVHSLAFRRLRHKTQVFMAPASDHIRVRLTHSLEVAQIGRTIARALGLNEDLTEAIALAHDIGHPPFGHAGEAALQAATAAAGGFDHNGHTLRVLMRLERAYPHHAGLDLGWDTLEGLAKHNGPVTAPGWALAAADAEFPLELASWPSLEAQVAALADDIAYDNHDIDDGLRAGLLTLDQLAAAPLVGERLPAVRARLPGLDEGLVARELVREQIGAMVTDLVAETRARLAEARPRSVDEVRIAGRPLVGFSPAVAAGERALKRFMYDNLYHHPRQCAAAATAHAALSALVAAYRAAPDLLPPDWRARLPDYEPWRTRHVVDYLAGMTDGFALARAGELPHSGR